MTTFSRMPRYDIRNDGSGPYAIFYCDQCGREFRSLPNVANTLTQDIGRSAASGLLRKIPLVGRTVAENMLGDDPRYSTTLTPAQVDAAWQETQRHFRECPTCNRIVCLSDFDAQSGFCQEDSPRGGEIAESRGEQAGAVIKGFASAFGLDKVVQQASESAQQAASQMARCPNDGTLAKEGTKFCPNCGAQMIQPAKAVCANCGAETMGAKFCPNCGAKVTPAAPAGVCPSCGAKTEGAKFCPECGTKQA